MAVRLPLGESTKEYNIVVLGSHSVGRTSTITQFIHELHVSESPPLPSGDFSYMKRCDIDNTPCMLHIIDTFAWDTVEISALRDQQIASADAVVIMYSVTGRASFKDVEGIVSEVERLRKMKGLDAVLPIVIVGNKIDARQEEEEYQSQQKDTVTDEPGDSAQIPSGPVTYQEGEDVAKQSKCPFFEISAKDDKNLEKPFFEAVREVWKREREAEEKTQGQSQPRQALKDYLYSGQGKLKEKKATRPPVSTKSAAKNTTQSSKD